VKTKVSRVTGCTQKRASTTLYYGVLNLVEERFPCAVVRTQLGFEREGLGTETAVQSGPDLEMSPHMGVQVTGTVERFPAF